MDELFARKVIHDPAGVVFKNVMFVTIIWVQPDLEGPRVQGVMR